MQAFIEAVLNVLTIVALISATAFIIIFLVDLFLSINNKNGAIFFRSKRESGDDVRPKVEKESHEVQNTQHIFADECVRPQVLGQNEQLPVAQSWDEELAKQEQQAIESKSNEPILLDEPIEVKEQKQQQFVSDFDDFDSLFDDDFTEDKKIEDESQKDDGAVVDFDSMIDEINKECVTKYESSKSVEIVEPVQEILEKEATREDEDYGVVETKEEKIENLVEEQKANVVDSTDAKILNVYEYFPIDALNERLAKLQERLKVNERDLKANRKEYNPLARVNRSLKRDQEKLRRKEAIIARRKVLLYGVNNYVDIDEEKAKKLSEDLDLLDGLRLSVQHCEEVMEQNKDRFPILESTNRILVEQNKQIKDDIAEVKSAIDKLNSESAE